MRINSEAVPDNLPCSQSHCSLRSPLLVRERLLAMPPISECGIPSRYTWRAHTQYLDCKGIASRLGAHGPSPRHLPISRLKGWRVLPFDVALEPQARSELIHMRVVSRESVALRLLEDILPTGRDEGPPAAARSSVLNAYRDCLDAVCGRPLDLEAADLHVTPSSTPTEAIAGSSPNPEYFGVYRFRFKGS